MSCRMPRLFAGIIGFPSSFLGLSLWLALAAPACHSQDFRPDEVVETLIIHVQTADNENSATDDKIYFQVADNRSWRLNYRLTFRGLFDPNEWEEWFDDFERDARQDYPLDPGSMTVGDIRYVRLWRDTAWPNDSWQVAWFQVYVNHKLFYDSGTIDYWLNEDHASWTAPDFTPIAWPPLEIDGILPDTSPAGDYSGILRASGGRPPYTWRVACTLNQPLWTSGPSIAAVDSSRCRVTGRLANREETTILRVTVTDSQGRSLSSVQRIRRYWSMPAPLVGSFTPSYGWPTFADGDVAATRVTIQGQHFDSRAPGNTVVRFGEAAATILSVSENRLVVRVPSGARTGPIEVETPFGAGRSRESFQVFREGAYRGTYGFSFPDRPGGDLGWDLYRDLFGSDAVEYVLPSGEPIAKPMAGLFYGMAFRDAAEGGCSHGFALSSLRIRQGDGDPAFFRGTGAGTAWELGSVLDSRGLRVTPDRPLGRFLLMNQGAWLGMDCLRYVAGGNRAANPRLLPDEVRASLGTDNPRLLRITDDDGRSRAVVPYAIEEWYASGAGITSYIPTYDPSEPFDETVPDERNGLLTVYQMENDWRYAVSTDTFRRGDSLEAIPYSRYPARPALIADTDTNGLYLSLYGDTRAAQLADEEGRSFYNAGGAVNTDPGTKLPRIARVSPPGSRKETIPDTYFIAPKPALPGSDARLLPELAVEAVDHEGRPGGRYIAAAFAPGVVLSLGNLAATPGLRDRIVIDAPNGKASVTPASRQDSLWVDVIRRVPGDPGRTERVFTLAKAAIAAGTALTVESSATAAVFKVRAGKTGGASYHLLTETVNAAGRVRHFAGEFALLPGMTHAYSLPVKGDAALEVDPDGDGRFETRRLLTLTEVPGEMTYGDVNGDGKVSPTDAALGLRIAAGSVKAGADQIARGDVFPRVGVGGRVVGDSRFMIADVLEILRAAAGLSKLPPGIVDPYARPAIYPRLPDPLPASPPVEEQPFLRVPVTTVVDPNLIVIPKDRLPIPMMKAP